MTTQFQNLIASAAPIQKGTRIHDKKYYAFSYYQEIVVKRNKIENFFQN